MDKEQTKAAAAVMLAFDPNKENCQFTVKGKNAWVLCREPMWDWIRFDYRIAPEPVEVEVEVWVHLGGAICEKGCFSPESAHASGWTLRRATIHPEQP